MDGQYEKKISKPKSPIVHVLKNFDKIHSPPHTHTIVTKSHLQTFCETEWPTFWVEWPTFSVNKPSHIDQNGYMLPWAEATSNLSL